MTVGPASLARPPGARAGARWLRLACGAALLATVCRPAAAGVEQLEYGWKLKGFSGAILGLFFPDSGNASLVTETGPGESLTTVLELTSPHRQGDYYRYGSEIGTTGLPVRVWSAYHFRGKEKLKERAVEQEEVLDFASAIQMLRRERPAGVRYIRLWSDGREYPLTVTPSDEALVDCAGRSWTTRRYVIEGRKVDDQKPWKGRYQLWIADDEAATPVRIVGEKGMLTVRLELVDAKHHDTSAAATPPASSPANER